MKKQLNTNILSDKSGNFSLMFAVLMTVLLLGIGSAIDLSGMNSKRVKLQGIADAAALAAVVSGLNEKDDLQAFVDQFAEGMGYPTAELTLSITQNNTVAIDVSDNYSSLFMGVFNHKNRKIGAFSEVPLSGNLKVNLSLVLDTTQSMMNNGRMTALKIAVGDLIQELENSNHDGSENVKISLVPFADFARISPDLRDENWLERQPDQEVSWQVVDQENSTNCRMIGEGEAADLECDVYVYKDVTRFAEWVGCMGSRKQDFNKVVNFAEQRLQGFITNSECGIHYNIIEPLSSDLSSINSSVQALSAKGKTYLPAGLIWGWRTLDQRQPFAANDQTGEDAVSVMLLMTDGSNTVRLSDFDGAPGYNGLLHYDDGYYTMMMGIALPQPNRKQMH